MKRSIFILGVVALLFAFCGLGFAEEFAVSTAVELSDALASADSNGEDDTITLEAGTYEVSGDVTFVYDVIAYDEGSLTLTASGEVVLDGGGTDQVLSIESDYMTDITLVGLTIVSGDYEGDGGGVNIDIDAGNISVSGCHFEDNASAWNGGGLYAYVSDNGSIRVANCTFTGNTASGADSYSGGGLYADIGDTGDVSVADCVFTGNSCEGYGGAGYLNTYVGDLTVRGVECTENVAGYDGGAFYLNQDYSGMSTVEGSTFTGNSCDSDGGAVYFDPDAANTFVCRGNTFTGNEAEGEGGALYQEGDYTTTTIVEDNVFRQNTADDDGGGAMLEIDYGGVMTVVSNDFIDNSAGSYGGGLYAEGDDYGVTISIDDCLFEGNGADSYGGGLYVEMDDGEIVAIRNSTFLRNRASLSQGGGAYLEGDYGNFFLSGNNFTENEAAEYGGGLYSYLYEGNFYLGESVFDGNVVSGDYEGGGAYLECEYGDATVERSAFTNNSCGDNGGGLYVYPYYGDLIFRDNLIANNTSAGDGGGAYLEPEYVRYADIVNNTVTANTVTGDYNGGGLYVYCGDDNTIYSIANNIVWGNEAGGVSDDIFLYDNGYLNYFTVEDCDFSVLSTDFTASSDLYESGNLDEDPLFVSSTDFHLQANSPVIDMGDSEARSIGEIDLEGKVRVHGDAVDMGAYEFGSSIAGDGDDDDGDDDETGGSSGGCSVDSFAPALLLLVAPLSLLVRKR